MTLGIDEFAELVREHQNMVYSLALRVVRDTGLAEEVAQDVFMELLRSAGKLEGAEHTRFWLRRVAVHRATDALRRRAVRPDRMAHEWTEEFDVAATPDGAAWKATAGSLALSARMEELVGSLPEAFRVAIVLRYQEDMLPEEIAELLRQPVATVKSNLRRGLEMMRRKAVVTLEAWQR